ncbi:MAG: DUF4254 domain-containing protein [Casimicrobium sp.]
MALPQPLLQIDIANQPVTALRVKSFHDGCLAIASWPKLAVDFAEADVWRWVATNHRNNSLLWDEEDLARRTRATDADITANKRAIDGYNQARNDATERVDEFLLLSLGLIDAATASSDQPVARVNAAARLNSETAGSIMDRMSIMSLKIKAMTAQTVRPDVEADHRDASALKLQRLHEQRNDLGACLDQLLADSRAGAAYFKVYRQFKMYNDPRFNPVLVAEALAAAAGLKQAQSTQQ